MPLVIWFCPPFCWMGVLGALWTSLSSSTGLHGAGLAVAVAAAVAGGHGGELPCHVVAVLFRIRPHHLVGAKWDQVLLCRLPCCTVWTMQCRARWNQLLVALHSQPGAPCPPSAQGDFLVAFLGIALTVVAVCFFPPGACCALLRRELLLFFATAACPAGSGTLGLWGPALQPSVPVGITFWQL